MVAITVAVAAPIYVYVSNMPKPPPPVAVMLNLKYNEATGELTISHIGGDIIEDALFTYSTNGLVGYWKMDEADWDGTPDEVVDSSIEGNHGTAYGGANTTPNGKYGRAGSFDGVDDEVNCGNDANLNFDDTDEFTIEMWIYPNEEKNMDVLGKWSWTGWRGYFITGTFPEVLIIVGHNDSSVTHAEATGVTKDNWHHLVYTVNASQLSSYVDGTNKDTVPLTKSIVYPPNNFYLSHPEWAGPRFNGTIDEVRIYNRALSAEEIEANYYAVGEWGNLEVKFNGQLFDINNVSCSSGSDIRAGSTLTITQSLNSGDGISIVYKPANQLLRQYTIP